MNYRRSRILKSALMTTSAVALLAAPGVTAQEQDDDEVLAFEEIYVTSRKKRELIIEVPMNVAVVGAAEIKRRNLVNKEDVYRSIAGASNPGVGGNNMRGEIILRGLSGANDSTPETSSVFTDGIPFEFSDLYDVERIEVLRGPQGTLYGSNAIGGTVRIITNKPNMDEMEIGGSVMFKSERHRKGTETRGYAMINVPIIEGELALRVAGSSGSRTGKVINIFNGHRGGEQEEFLRAQLMWQPDDQTRINLSYVWQDYFSDENPAVDVSKPPYYYEAILTPNDAATYGYDVELTFPDCPQGASRPECKTFSIGSIVAPGDYNPDFATWFLLNQENYVNDSLFALTVERDNLIEGIDLFYAGSYRDTKFGGRQNHWSRYDTQDMFRTWIDDEDGYSRWTHELRLQSTGDQALEWTVGAFYDRKSYTPSDHVQWQYHASDNRSRAIADYLWGYWWGYEDPTQVGIDLYGDPNVHYNGTQLYWNERELAFFGEASYTFDVGETGKIELTGGVRFYDLKDDVHYVDTGLWAGTATITDDGESGNRKKFSVSYMPNNELSVFAIYSEGYRPGGNNGPSAPVSCRNDPAVGDYTDRYSSDQIKNYEVGVKGFLMDRRIQFSSAVYQIDWSGVQAVVRMNSCGFRYTTNAATARSRGLEFESTSIVTDSLKFVFNIAYTKSEMTSDVPVMGVESGDDMTMVPKYNFYAALDQELEVFGRDANVRLDVSGYGKYKSHFDVMDNDISPSYEVVNLSAGIQVNEFARVNLHVNNLLDKRIIRYRSGLTRGGDNSYWNIQNVYYADDRNVVLRLDFTF